MNSAFISGPIKAATPAELSENVRRAVHLARWSVERGYAPMCAHPGVAAGMYGREEVPAERERGLRICEALAADVARSGGAMFVILRDDGTASQGVAREVRAYFAATATDAAPRVVGCTWQGWLALGVTA